MILFLFFNSPLQVYGQTALRARRSVRIAADKAELKLDAGVHAAAGSIDLDSGAVEVSGSLPDELAITSAKAPVVLEAEAMTVELSDRAAELSAGRQKKLTRGHGGPVVTVDAYVFSNY